MFENSEAIPTLILKGSIESKASLGQVRRGKCSGYIDENGKGNDGGARGGTMHVARVQKYAN